MKKIFTLICVLFLLCGGVYARHIKGGVIQYLYVGAGSAANSSVYTITVTVYRNCDLTGPMPSALTIYDAVSHTIIQQINNTTNLYTLQSVPTKSTFDPCLSNPPKICYQVYTYSTNVELPNNANGYIIAVSDANRIAGIINVENSSGTGITFTATIPGVLNGTDYHVNSTPVFEFKDTAVICYNSHFEYQVAAADKDGDRLTYSFGDGLNGTATATQPPYYSIPYSAGYSGVAPLGPAVTIDSVTGIISGTAPATNGEYVISVYAHEWRNGVLFNSTKKELQIIVADCSLTGASLNPLYINCSSYSLTFANESTASNITSYAWDFGVPNTTMDVSTSPSPTYTYADTGTYKVKLVVGNAGGCKDSATTVAKIYPGFTPYFAVTGRCYQSPFVFTDQSTAKYGAINSWSWNIGDSSNPAAFTSQNVSYTYTGPQTSVVSLAVTSTLGCSGSFTSTVSVSSKPYIYLPFTDTLICSIDTLPLKAQVVGNFAWTPNKMISDTSKLNPLVYPKDSSVYTITVKDNGCVDSAKIHVNVLPFVKVTLSPDTAICKTDSIVLRPASYALSYRWRESPGTGTMSSYNVKYPTVAPGTTSTYFVTGNLGYCQDSAKITVKVSPYPSANLGADTAICYGQRIQLHARIVGSSFSWSPAAELLNASTLNPTAGPDKTTSYTLTVRDTFYCPKPGYDTILVKVIPIMTVNAGNDTSVALNQPLQLDATGSSETYRYTWTPGTFLDNAGIANPVATITSPGVDSIWYSVKVTSPEGCSASDNILIHVYKNGPDIFVPSGFTPNGDGLNDVLHPILVGISVFQFFTIYNRFGQPVFSTSDRSAHWDGNFHGSPQPGGAYVYMAQGKDETGKVIFKKGTVVLIR